MTKKTRVAILDDHQGIIDGYLYRLSNLPDIEVVATITFGEALEPLLAKQQVDVLILDVTVPTSAENLNPYPILYLIPKLLQKYPELTVLVITMHAHRTLIHSVLEAGASGYVLKDDQMTIRELPAVIRSISSGGIHLSLSAFEELKKRRTGALEAPLSARQMEVLSLSASYPDASTADLAKIMSVANSTVRNLLSSSYLKLNVRNRTAAVAKARQLGLITPEMAAPKYP